MGKEVYIVHSAKFFEEHNFHGLRNEKFLTETILYFEGILSRFAKKITEPNFCGPTPIHAENAVPHQSAENAKIMRLENLAIYGMYRTPLNPIRSCKEYGYYLTIHGRNVKKNTVVVSHNSMQYAPLG